jgi:hypothetical protein
VGHSHNDSLRRLNMVVLPTTFSLEVGKDADHQVRASAKSGLSSLTWMRVGWTNPTALESGYPFT